VDRGNGQIVATLYIGDDTDADAPAVNVQRRFVFFRFLPPAISIVQDQVETVLYARDRVLSNGSRSAALGRGPTSTTSAASRSSHRSQPSR
jgi:hypothetical protein